MCASRGRVWLRLWVADCPASAASAGVSGGDTGKEAGREVSAAVGPGSVPTMERSLGFLGSAGSLHKVALEVMLRVSNWSWKFPGLFGSLRRCVIGGRTLSGNLGKQGQPSNL